MGRGSPGTTGIGIDGFRTGFVEALSIVIAIFPCQLRSIPDGTAIDTSLFHDGTDTGSTRILPLAFAYQVVHGTFPSAVVVADAVVLGKTGDKRSNRHTLVVVETAGGGVFIQPKDGLWIFLAGLQELRFALQLANGIQRMAPDVTAEADGQETAVLMRHLHQLGKQCPTINLFR